MADPFIATVQLHLPGGTNVNDHPLRIPWANSPHHYKWQLDRFSRFCMVNANFSLYVTLHCPISPKNLPFPVAESELVSNTLFVGPIRPTIPNRISIKSAIFAQYIFITNEVKKHGTQTVKTSQIHCRVTKPKQQE